MHRADFDLGAASLSAGCRPGNPTSSIYQSITRRHTVKMAAINTSALAKLPIELLSMVLGHLGAADQVCLFLTCKSLWGQYGDTPDMQAIFGPSPDARQDFGLSLVPCWDMCRFLPDSDETGRLELLRRLQPQLRASGSFLCGNCRCIHVGQPPMIGLDDAESTSSHDFWRVYQAQGLCWTCGSSFWERRRVEIDGSALAFPVARKIDFQARIKDRKMECHRVSRVVLPASAVAHFSRSSAPVVLTFRSCPFIICGHFALRYMNTDDVPLSEFGTTIFADMNSTVTHLDTSRGWVLPFDTNNPGVVPPTGERRGRYFACRICGCLYGLAVHFHGELGVEVVLDSFYNYTTQRDMKRCWDPRWVKSKPGPSDMFPHEVDDIWAALPAWDWFFPTPLLVPYASGRTDESFDAIARALTEE